MDHRKIKNILREIAAQYPVELQADQFRDVERITYNLGLILSHTNKGRVCDLGGGIGMLSVGCAAMGLESVLVDDFSDPINKKIGDGILQLHRKFGVKAVSADVLSAPLNFAPESFDCISTFDSMEHWHHSPRKLFAQVRSYLKIGGKFILSGPNCVNLRKRLTVPFGRGKWSQLSDWYEQERFRGHVREPDVRDLLYIARDMRLKNVRVTGRNWHGLRSKRAIVRAAAKFSDWILRLRPGLCSDIYMVGYKMDI